jgi:lambda family phage portal protein
VVVSGLFERLFPGLALARMKTRIRLEAAKRVYDAAKSTAYRVLPTDQRSADAVMDQAKDKVRRWARHLDENHDLSIGVLDVLVNNIIGTGIMIEPMVKTRGGENAAQTNKDIRKLLKDWARRPEVTGELPFGEAQRLTCRAWLRDGEALIQHVRGPRFPHFSAVPYSMELIEADLLPFEAITGRDRVIHGVEKNAWGTPSAYYLFKQHPGNALAGLTTLRTDDLRRIRAADMVHLKFTRRFRQTRGVSIFHGVITRLDDIKDYEESERIAARVAASLTAFIKKGEDFTGEASAISGDRAFEMQAGMVFDNLQVGEDVGMIKSDRPNTGLGAFVQTQQRALAAGTGTNYSSIAKDYSGTYSSQRQELVESQPAYARLREYFIELLMRRVYQEFVSAAVLSGVLALPAGIDMETLFEADMRAPGIPWIDPKKEVEAEAVAIEQRIRSRTQVIRDHGGDPDVVEEQIKKERERDRENGFEPVAATQPVPGAGNGAGGDDDGDGGEDDGETEEDGDSTADRAGVA